LRSFNSTIRVTDAGFTATTGTLPAGLRDALPANLTDPMVLRDDFPVARGEAVLQRTDPVVTGLAGYVLESALDPSLPPQLRPASRCAVVRTDAVATRTTLLLTRFRFHLTLPSRHGERTIVAEDAALLGFAGSTAQPTWLTPDEIEALLQARATANVAQAQAQSFISRVLDNLADITPHLDAHGDELAGRIVASHRRVRSAAGEIRRGLSVTVERPADLLGVYVFIPEVST